MQRTPLWVFQLAAWLGAFLLFHLELLVAKLLLPLLGGSAYVWTTCVTVYQALLLAGYAGYGWLARRAGVVRYSRWHLALLVIGLAWLPLRLPAASSTLLIRHPLIGLVWMLCLGIGIPFLLLSITSLVIQGWFARAPQVGDRPAHALYAASNLGSFAALAVFPLLFEPWLTLDAQRALWGWLYALLIVLLAWCLPRAARTHRSERRWPSGDAVVGARRPVVWCLLSAASCAFVLAMTNALTIELGTIALVWVLPMMVYLLTWVLNFKTRPWYPRWLPLISCGAVVAVAVVQAVQPSLTLASFRYTAFYVLIFHVILFSVCMLCHRHLWLTRPAAEHAWPAFYLWVAVGGWAGGTLISLVLPLAMRHTSTTATDWIIAMVLVLIALCSVESAAVLAAARRRPILAITGTLVLIGVGGWGLTRGEPGLRYAARNLYGISRVVDRRGLRVLQHGTTIHGQQFLDPARAMTPLTYYHPHGPLGDVFARAASARRVAAIGLGAGSMAGYLRAGQTWDVYELDPDVVDIARRYFTYLARGPVAPRVVIGDGRRALAAAGAPRYDLIVVDAFNGDAIPTHLLTLEAFRVYLDHLAPDGAVALHLSSRHYRLLPVVAAAARALGLRGAMRTTYPEEVIADEELPSQWVVVARTPEAVALLRRSGWLDLRQADPNERIRPWTDQHANLLAALAWGGTR